MSEKLLSTEARKTPEQIHAQQARIAAKIVSRAKNGHSSFGNTYHMTKEGPISGTTENSSIELDSMGGAHISRKISNNISETGTSTYIGPEGKASVTLTGRSGSEVVNRHLDARDSNQAQQRENVLSDIPAQLAEFRGNVADHEIAMELHRKELTERLSQKAA